MTTRIAAPRVAARYLGSDTVLTVEIHHTAGIATDARAPPIEVHKALADDTRYRLYRYLRLSGRPVSVRELAVRLSLHPNTLRPHLRRLEEAGLVAREIRQGVHRGAAPDPVHGRGPGGP